MGKLTNSQLGNSLPRWSQKILLSLLGFLLVAAVMYFQYELLNAQAMAEDNRLNITQTDQSVVRLEVQFEMIERSLERIELRLGTLGPIVPGRM